MVIAYILKLYSADGASAFQTSYFSSVCQYSSTAWSGMIPLESSFQILLELNLDQIYFEKLIFSMWLQANSGFRVGSLERWRSIYWFQW